MYRTEKEEEVESEWKKEEKIVKDKLIKKRDTHENVRKHRKKSQTTNWGDDLIKAPLNWAQLSILCNQSFNIMKHTIHYT